MTRKRIMAVLVVAVGALAGILWIERSTPPSRRMPRESTAERPDPRELTETPGHVAAELASFWDGRDLDVDAHLHGIVSTETGDPVPGALVTASAELVYGVVLRGAERLTSSDPDSILRSSHTDAGGLFALRLPRDLPVSLAVAASGFAKVRVTGCRAGHRINVVLRRCQRLSVLVLGYDAAPLSDATVLARAVSVDGATYPLTTATTGPDGRCMLEELPTGTTITAVASKIGHATARRAGTLPVDRTEQWIIELPERPLIHGRVVNATTRMPIRGAYVSAGSPWLPVVQTDEDGRFAYSRLVEVDAPHDGHLRLLGMRELEISAPGFARLLQEARALPGFAEYALEPLALVEGYVHDERGAPVAGADVCILTWNYDSGPRTLVAEVYGRTDDSGRFRILGGIDDGWHRVIVTARGYGRYVRDLRVSDTGIHPLGLDPIVLKTGTTIQGTVVTSDGEPAARAFLTLEGGDVERPAGVGIEEPAPGTSLRVRTDYDGRFSFSDMPHGTYRLAARSDGTARTVTKFMLSGNEGLVHVSLTLRPGRPDEEVVQDTLCCPPLSGTITRVNDAAGFVELSIGSADGVALASRLHVLRNGMKVTAVRIVQVRERSSLGALDVRGVAQLGDTVTDTLP